MLKTRDKPNPVSKHTFQTLQEFRSRSKLCISHIIARIIFSHYFCLCCEENLTSKKLWITLSFCIGLNYTFEPSGVCLSLVIQDYTQYAQSCKPSAVNESSVHRYIGFSVGFTAYITAQMNREVQRDIQTFRLCHLHRAKNPYQHCTTQHFHAFLYSQWKQCYISRKEKYIRNCSDKNIRRRQCGLVIIRTKDWEYWETPEYFSQLCNWPLYASYKMQLIMLTYSLGSWWINACKVC